MSKPPKPPKNEPDAGKQPDADTAEKMTLKEMDRRNIVLAMNTMSGDLRDFILERLKYDKSTLPWDIQGEDAQKNTIERVTDYATRFVEKAVDMIAASGRPVMVGTLKKVQVKDGIQCQIDFAKQDELRHDLFDATGQSVLVIVSSADKFIGSRGDVKVNPDQARMDLDAEREIIDEPGPGDAPDEGTDDDEGPQQPPDAPKPDDDTPLF